MMLLNLVYCLLVTAPHSGLRPCGALPSSCPYGAAQGIMFLPHGSTQRPSALCGVTRLLLTAPHSGLRPCGALPSSCPYGAAQGIMFLPHGSTQRPSALCGVTRLLLTAPHCGFALWGSTKLLPLRGCSRYYVSSSRPHTALRLCGVTGILSLRDCLRYNSPFSILNSSLVQSSQSARAP